MKNIFVFLLFIPAFLNAGAIQDDQLEDLAKGIHSYGLMTYGLHSNTFHIRNIFLKGIYSFNKDLKLFATIRAYKDTHIPETNYQTIQPNISLYDYGFSTRFFGVIDVSLRGAAVYRKNQISWLLLPALHDALLPTEFDDSTNLIPEQLNAAGIRIGLHLGSLTLGYSQGDWRHSIPMGILAKYIWEHHTLRFVLQMQNGQPIDYSINDYRQTAQLAFISELPLKNFTLRLQEEITYKFTSEYWLKLEQSLEWNQWKLGIRELIHQGALLVDASIKYDLGPLDLGIQTSSEGHYYIGSVIEF